jgi:hypothetical protein
VDHPVQVVVQDQVDHQELAARVDHLDLVAHPVAQDRVVLQDLLVVQEHQDQAVLVVRPDQVEVVAHPVQVVAQEQVAHQEHLV